MPNAYYHVTTTLGWNSIQIQGRLMPMVGERSAELNETPGVFLFTSEDALVDGLGNWLGDCFDEDEVLHVLLVDVEGLELDQEVEWEAISRHPIDMERISYLRPE